MVYGAGTIVVAAEALDLNNGSLSASTQSGSGGNINLTIAQACQNNGSTTATNSLSLNGKGGIPPAPDLPLDSQTISLGSSNVDSNPPGIETSQGKIQPARGIRVTKSGQISLTAYPTDNSGNRLSNHLTNCDRI